MNRTRRNKTHKAGNDKKHRDSIKLQNEKCVFKSENVEACNSHENQEITTNNAEGRPYKVKESDILGRYLVAAHDLLAGREIINVQPLVVGPCQNSAPMCLGCYHLIENVQKSFRCCQCQWPLCSPRCPGLGSRFGHTLAECALLASCHSHNHMSYNAIVPLRCLLLKDCEPEKWRQLNMMEHHNAIRRSLPHWAINQAQVVDTIRDRWDIRLFSEEEIHTMCGILEVNAFEVGQPDVSLRAVYLEAYLLSHDCVANTSHTDGAGYRLKICTSMPILQGQPITLNYAYSLQGTMKRRQHLKESKFFECCCSRCRDPTELGTYASALKCPKCEKGYLLSTAPLEPRAPWRCRGNSCIYSITAQYVNKLMERLSDEVERTDHDDVDALERLLTHYSRVLHPNHYLRLALKHSLSQLYGKTTDYMIHNLTEELLQRKIEICQQLMTVFDVIEPGLTRLRGVTLYELHAPLMILTTRKFEKHTISKKELKCRLKEVVRCLREASTILSFEGETSAEGIMCLAAKDALLNLKDWEQIIGRF